MLKMGIFYGLHHHIQPMRSTADLRSSQFALCSLVDGVATGDEMNYFMPKISFYFLL